MKPDVAAYYNQTQNHYKRWWHLDTAMALHYGIWFDETKTFLEALNNTNVYLAELGKLERGQKVLDAGCGVGGSAIFLAKKFNCQVIGITLSDLQIETAKRNAQIHNVPDKTNFLLLDYSDTNLPANSFDVIWACESSSSSPDKHKTINEWFRLLKPGGKLVLADFFRSEEEQIDQDHLLVKWTNIWAMSPLVTIDELINNLQKRGFTLKENKDLTANIYRTARKMHHSYWLGLIPALVYNLILGARPYARNHYKSGLYQYKALMQDLWQYRCIVAHK